jgi:hypothetical protein
MCYFSLSCLWRLTGVTPFGVEVSTFSANRSLPKKEIQMNFKLMTRSGLVLLASTLLCGLILIPSGDALSQKRPPSMRDFLYQFKGKEIQIMDKTGGTEQFTGGEAAKSYTLILNDVQNDYIIVSRNTSTDKRTFVYPISVIRRIIFEFAGRPYDKILLEMY